MTLTDLDSLQFAFFDYYNYGKFELISQAKDINQYNNAATHLFNLEDLDFTEIEPIGNWTSGNRWFWIFQARRNQSDLKYYLLNDLGWFKEPIEIENSLSDIFNATKLDNGYLRYTSEWYDQALSNYREDIPILFDVYEETIEIEKIWELLNNNNIEYDKPDKNNVDPFVLLEYFVKKCDKFDLIEVSDSKFGVLKSDSKYRIELFRKGFLRACYNKPPEELYK